jgi:cobyrinic acid a,c-diamide synthase
MKGILIAGTHSGCGKTTVTLGILAALKEKGLKVQPFKAGPDFIDAGLHGIVVGRPSRNLDQWMCGRDYVIDSFTRHAAQADIAVIEGVMGLYDGDFSPASLASLLQVPVILVVDGYGMAESAGAVVKGYSEFGIRNSECGVKTKDLRFAGVIFNRVASESHYKRLKDSVRDVPVLGYLPRDIDFEIPHRHLGLTIAEEGPLPEKSLAALADAVLRHIDVDRICESAVLGNDESDRHVKDHFAFRIPNSAFRLAVAYDKAFSFYYEDNFDLLRDAGAEIVRFSPLADRAIPDADAVYIGGGYPEIHADALSSNSSMLSSIRAWSDAGKPMYAECGGLMYLSKGIRDFDNKLFGMAGVFPFETRMMRKPRLGYREIVLKEDCILGNKEEKYRGHEFHYSEINAMRNAEFGIRSESNAGLIYSVHDAQGREKGEEGFRYKNTLASYVHIHFGSNERRAVLFADFVRRN